MLPTDRCGQPGRSHGFGNSEAIVPSRAESPRQLFQEERIPLGLGYDALHLRFRQWFGRRDRSDQRRAAFRGISAGRRRSRTEFRLEACPVRTGSPPLLLEFSHRVDECPRVSAVPDLNPVGGDGASRRRATTALAPLRLTSLRSVSVRVSLKEG